jgi:hypothetical protein
MEPTKEQVHEAQRAQPAAGDAETRADERFR